MIRLCVIEYIDCAHFLPKHPRCGELHGHTYKVEMRIEGQKHDGMVMDFADLKQILRDVLRLYDHKSMNDFLEYPSVENICELLGKRLIPLISYPFSLRVWEGVGKWAEISHVDLKNSP